MKGLVDKLSLLLIAVFVLANISYTATEECPVCSTSKIIDCVRMNKTLEALHEPDYKCLCKYFDSEEKLCRNAKTKNYAQNQSHYVLDIEKFKPKEILHQSNLENECLSVHVGYAVRGHNLIHRQWINKEHCFNLCLTTHTRNGDAFNCRSFEHWHRDCSTVNQNDDTSMCASFTENEEQPEILHHAHFHHHRRTKRAAKLDICVLSNQTIKSSGDDFARNSAVTYYELICKKPTIYISEAKANKFSTSLIIFEQKPFTNQLKLSSNSVSIPMTSTIKSVTRKKENSPRMESEYVEVARKNRNDTKKYENSVSKEDLMITNKKCKFNPCLNDGACLLIDTQRFTCLCKDFFYGVYCEHRGISKVCHHDRMDIVISIHELADQLRIELSDLYVNEIFSDNESPCRLKILNDTHAKFSVPYDKCSTKITNMYLEKIYLNKLYSAKKIESKFTNDKSESENNFLIALECRIDKTTTIESSSLISSSETQTQILSSRFCLVDFLSLKLQAYKDENYREELAHDIFPTNNTQIDLNQKIYARVSVEYSEKLNELYQLLDKYQIKLHLTLSYCWLAPTKNGNLNIYQVLIENGCPKQKVRFHDKAISSLRFSFNVYEWILKETNQFYIHCLPDICTDSTSSMETNSNNNFKSCQNITNQCQNQYFLSRHHKDKMQSQLQEISNKNLLSNQQDCNYQLSKGPIFIANKNSNTSTSQQVNKLTITNMSTAKAISSCAKAFEICYNLIKPFG